MVRSALQVAVALALLTGAACSDKKKPDDPKAIAAVCATRTKVEAATLGGKANLQQFVDVVEGLETAIKSAPKDIKPAFETVHSIFVPFVNALIASNGDPDAASVDKEYLKALEAVGVEQTERASANVRGYYASHC